MINLTVDKHFWQDIETKAKDDYGDWKNNPRLAQGYIIRAINEVLGETIETLIVVNKDTIKQIAKDMCED